MASARYRGRMIVNDTDYTGSFVDPNPSGTATDTLQKVDIDGVIYDIQGGGSSGGAVYTEAVLWNNPTSTSSWSNPVIMTLNDNITNYHELKVVFSNQSGDSYGYITIPVSEVLAHNYTQYFSNDAISGTSNYALVSSINEIKCYPKDSGITTYYVKVIGIKYGGNLSPIIYSTEEREVGVWTNGKPLYAKTFIQQLSGNAGQVDISACGADMMFVHSGYYDIGVTMLGLNERLNNQYLTYTHVNVDTMQYIDCTNTIATNSTIVVCCLYTKTTDVAGSGAYTTLGVPAVHYSTDEQVIGTWIDGKPIYQKSYQLAEPLSVRANAWVSVAGIELQNVDTPINCIVSDGKAVQSWVSVDFKDTPISIGHSRNVAITVQNFTFQYTKTTD